MISKIIEVEQPWIIGPYVTRKNLWEVGFGETLQKVHQSKDLVKSFQENLKTLPLDHFWPSSNSLHDFSEWPSLKYLVKKN